MTKYGIQTQAAKEVFQLKSFLDPLELKNIFFS